MPQVTRGTVDAGRGPSVATLIWIAVAAVAAVVLVLGGVLFAFMVDETQFARPDDRFDELISDVEDVPTVTIEYSNRWVEAPFFAPAIAWVGVEVERAQLEPLLDRVCASPYPEPVNWTVSVHTDAGSTVTLAGEAGAGDTCVAFELDTAAFLDEIDRVAPGIQVQPTVWEEGQFALVEMVDAESGLAGLVSLVAEADTLAAAAGFDSARPVEINSMSLGITVWEGESADYATLLTTLMSDYGVSTFWADGGGTPIDGVENVQVTAPTRHLAEIEALIAASGLHIADFPVRLVEG